MSGRMPFFAVLCHLPVRLRAWARALLAVVFLLLPLPARADAGTVAFSWAQVPLATDLVQPSAMAMDSSGNVYIADTGHDRVLKATHAWSGAFAHSMVYLADGSSPSGVAVDSQGNVYIAVQDGPAGSKMVKAAWDPDNQTYTSSDLFSEPSRFLGVAVDSQGVVYYSGTDMNGANPFVNKATPPTPPGTVWGIQSALGSTAIQDPTGLAMGSDDTLYIADRSAHKVWSVTSGGTVATAVDLSGYHRPTVLSAPAPTPVAVAVTSDGLYIADSANNEILKVQGGTIVADPVAQGLPGVTAVAAAHDSTGEHVYYAGATDAFAILPVKDFGSVKVGDGGPAAMTAAFVFASATTVQSAVTVMQGAPTQEYQVDPGGSSIAGTSFSPDQVALVNVSFHPGRPGARYGAVQLLDANNDPLATVLLQGVGTGPQVQFPRTLAPTEPFSSPLDRPHGVAVGADGALYVSDKEASARWRIRKATPDGDGAYGPATVVVGGLLFEPCGLAVDGAGNVYFTDVIGELFVVVRTGSGYAPLSTPLLTGLGADSPAAAVAVDGTGAVYVTNPLANPPNATRWDFSTSPAQSVTLLDHPQDLTQFPPSTVTMPTPTALALAPDGSGDVWIGDLVGGLWKAARSGGIYPIVAKQRTLPQQTPIFGLAIDAAGGIFTLQHNTIQADWSAGMAPYMGDLQSGAGLALDAAGNLYVTDDDPSASRLFRLDAASAPTLAFGSLPVGTSSSPQTLYVRNNGNALLTFPAPVADGNTNPSLQPGTYSVDGSSTFSPIPFVGMDQTLPAGSSALLNVVFSPAHVGADNGSLALTDTHLNLGLPHATQSVILTGAGTIGTATITLEPADQAKSYTGSGVVPDFTLSPQGATAHVTYTGPGYPATTTPPTAPGLYAFTIDVDGPDYQGASRNGTLRITLGTVSVSLNPADLDQVFDTHPHLVGYSPSGVEAIVTYSGTTYAGATYPATTTPPVEAGTYTVTVTTTDPSYQVATDTRTLTVAKAAATVHLDPATLTQVATGSGLSVGCTVVPAGTPVTVTYVGTGYGPTSAPPAAVGSYQVTAHIDSPNYAGADAVGTFQITAPASSTTDPAMLLQADATTLQAYQPVTFIATVTGSGGSRPTGTVTFTRTGEAGGISVPLVPVEGSLSAVASLPIPAPGTAGSYSYTASYAGDGANNPASASRALTVEPMPGITISAPDRPGAPLTVVVSPGLSVTMPFKVQMEAEVRAPLQFTMVNLPPSVTASFDPPTPILAGGFVTNVVATFRMRRQDSVSGRRPELPTPLPGAGGAAGAFLACGLLAFPWARRSRLRGRARIGFGLAMVLAAGLLGCWSRHPRSTVYQVTLAVMPANAPAGTPPVASVPVQLTVEP